MTGIYEISNPGVFAPTNRPLGCGVFHVSTQATESFYNHAAVPVTPDVTLTPSPAINLDGSDMVRMSWPEADDVIGWVLERGIQPSTPPEHRRGDRDYLSRIARDLKCDWRAIQDHGMIFDESTPRSGRIEWAEYATQFQHNTTIPDVIG